MKIKVIEMNPIFSLQMVEKYDGKLYYRVIRNYSGHIMYQDDEYKNAYNWMWANESLYSDRT